MSTQEHETRTTLIDQFHTARGVEADEDWAARATLTMVTTGQVGLTASERTLRPVLDLVRETGEGPEELYGPADQWAREQLRAWAAEGSEVLHDEPAQWRDLPQLAAITGAGTSLLLGLAAVLQGEWAITWTLGWLVLPFVGSLVALGAVTLRERVVARHSQASGAAAALAVVAAGSSALAGVFLLTNPYPVARASVLWCLPLAALHAGLAWLFGRLLPGRPARRGPLDDAAWQAELARILRSRGDTTETQVRHILDEATSHALQAGTTLHAEFGAPAAYAAQVAPRPLVRARRSALYRVGMFALWLWLCWDLVVGADTWPARLFWWTGLAALGLSAASTLWRYARFSWQARRAADDPADPVRDEH